MLADAVIGNTKSGVAWVFGPPTSAVLAPNTAVVLQANFWQANTWYYPLPSNGPLAMAVEFTDDLARRVQFLRAPGL